MVFLGPGPIIYGISKIIEFNFLRDSVEHHLTLAIVNNTEIFEYVFIELFPILTIFSLVSYEFIYKSAKKDISKKEPEDTNEPNFKVGVLKFRDITHPDSIDTEAAL